MEVLVNAGWDANLVMEMDDVYRTGLSILHIQRTNQAGAFFDFKTKQWKKPDPPKK